MQSDSVTCAQETDQHVRRIGMFLYVPQAFLQHAIETCGSVERNGRWHLLHHNLGRQSRSRGEVFHMFTNRGLHPHMFQDRRMQVMGQPLQLLRQRLCRVSQYFETRREQDARFRCLKT